MFAKALLLGACAALAAAQSSVLQITFVPNPVTDGKPNAITYTTNDTTTPVTIILRKGVATNLQNISTLTTTASNGQYIWTPPYSLPNGNDYALEIIQGSQFNYYGSFVVQGENPALVSSSSSSSVTASSTASSANSSSTSTSNSTASSTTTKSSSTSSSSSKSKTTSTIVTQTGTALPITTPSLATSTSAPTNTNAAAASELVGSTVLGLGGMIAFMLL